ncbi:uncharacterized protein [Dermacentor andersoni]|uniref:uncharacterized protein n=1 Tax=Dermacentor andersoni TaxID=34620 RepID=UPI002417D84D|nr:uncharacterized protein LOC129386922 [Dermacentor andersoni]
MEDVIFTPVSSGTRTLPPAAALQRLDLSNWHQQGASSGHGRAATMRSLLSSPFCFLMQGAFLPVLHSVADHSSDPSRIVTQGSWKPALSRGLYILKASPRQTRPWGPPTHKFMVLSFWMVEQHWLQQPRGQMVSRPAHCMWAEQQPEAVVALPSEASHRRTCSWTCSIPTCVTS